MDDHIQKARYVDCNLLLGGLKEKPRKNQRCQQSFLKHSWPSLSLLSFPQKTIFKRTYPVTEFTPPEVPIFRQKGHGFVVVKDAVGVSFVVLNRNDFTVGKDEGSAKYDRQNPCQGNGYDTFWLCSQCHRFYRINYCQKPIQRHQNQSVDADERCCDGGELPNPTPENTSFTGVFVTYENRSFCWERREFALANFSWREIAPKSFFSKQNINFIVAAQGNWIDFCAHLSHFWCRFRLLDLSLQTLRSWDLFVYLIKEQQSKIFATSRAPCWVWASTCPQGVFWQKKKKCVIVTVTYCIILYTIRFLVMGYIYYVRLSLFFLEKQTTQLLQGCSYSNKTKLYQQNFYYCILL